MGKKDKKVHSKIKGTEMVFSSLSLPASLVEDLKLLRDCYEETWKEGGERERVTYEKVFERLLSKSGLGHVDPDVYKEFMSARETRKKLPEVVTRATRKIVDELNARAQENGTSLKEEARNAQEEARENLEKVRAGIPYIDPHSPIDSVLTDMAGTAAVPTDQELQEDPRLQEAYGEKEKVQRTEKRFVHPDGRWYRAEQGSSTWVPVDPHTGKWMKVKPVMDQGYILMDVVIG